MLRFHVAGCALVACLSFLCSVATASAQRPGGAPTAEQLSRATWVVGRVALPERVPAGETLELVALGLEGEFAEHAVPLAADGGFKVAFARDVKEGALRLRGRYLHLDRPHVWRKDDAQPVELVASLGGVVQGRLLLPPPAASTSAPVDSRTSISPASFEGAFVRAFGFSVEAARSFELVAPLAQDGTFEFTALPAKWQLEIGFVHPAFAPASLASIVVEAGRAQMFELPLQRAAVVRGIVVDEAGVGIEGARIEVLPLDALLGLELLGALERPLSRADGAFEIGGLPEGRVRIGASVEGFLPGAIEVASLASGEVRTDLVLRLERGPAIRGSVRDEAGKPVAACEVLLVGPASTSGAVREERRARTDADGRFHVTGLGTTVRDVFALDGDRRAEARGVVPGGDELSFVLTPGWSIVGNVHDDLGRFVHRFSIGVVSADRDPATLVQSDTRVQEFRGVDGSFRFDGLEAGRWYVWVQGRGIAHETPFEVTIPRAVPPHSLVIRRTATIAGVVEDASGTLLKDAHVSVTWTQPTMPGRPDAENKVQMVTGGQGTFELREIRPGSVVLRIADPDQKVLYEERIELAVGEHREGQRLKVR